MERRRLVVAAGLWGAGDSAAAQPVGKVYWIGTPGSRLTAVEVAGPSTMPKGAKPADLTLGRHTKFRLFINVSAAQAQGVLLAQSLLRRVDEAME